MLIIGDDSGTSVDVTQTRKKSGIKRQLSGRRPSNVSSAGSEVSSQSPRRRVSRMLSKQVDTEKERLQKELQVSYLLSIRIYLSLFSFLRVVFSKLTQIKEMRGQFSGRKR